MSKFVLSGNLQFLGLGEVLQLIGSNGGTGVLNLMSKYMSEPGQIYFSKGNIMDARAGSVKGLDAVYALFGWIEGEFAFSEEEINVPKVIRNSRMEIILDGLRMVDDGHTKKLGPVDYEKKDSGSRSAIPIIKGPLVDYMYVAAEEEFYKNRKIVQENKHGSWIWVVLEGIVDVIKEGPEGPVPIVRMGAGSFIGGVSCFLFKDNVRKATIQASTDVQLGVLDSQRLADEFGNQSREFRDMVVSLDKRRDEITEKTVDVFFRRFDLKEFTKGKQLAKKRGIHPEKLYRIRKGSACIIRKTDDGSYIPLANLKERDFTGPCPFLDIGHEPHGGIVFVSEDIETEEMDAESLKEEYNGLSSALRNLIETTATNITITTRVAADYHKKNLEKK
ncbi:MAG: DUF4388 domain-containing protein [Desulfococcaceae bacterium]|jgi:CRP-like cAMP-binding protein|nr:DUF4388 domain-containing protein [Desulfococcaceae bacterium]